MTDPQKQPKPETVEWRCSCNYFLVEYDPRLPCYLYRRQCPGCGKKDIELDRRWVKERAA